MKKKVNWLLQKNNEIKKSKESSLEKFHEQNDDLTRENEKIKIRGNSRFPSCSSHTCKM